MLPEPRFVLNATKLGAERVVRLAEGDVDGPSCRAEA